MKKDFIDYIKKEFNFDDKEVRKFEESLKHSLKKSIRINTNKISISDFKNRVEKKWWVLTSTNLWSNIFYIDRPESELKIALWNTPEHISGYFYVQEVAASSSPFYMSSDKIDESKYLILDMSASPWWKTTQLLEYYPNSLIVANELDKGRLKWFFSNLDRMWWVKSVATNYDARFFKQIPEIFDKVLIDAPCSWEWTAFKTDDALKYWNIKNIKTVAKLQFWLLEAAIKTCKKWWEIVYSTCTLNKLENEEVIEKVLKKYWDYIEIVPLSDEYKYKRNWPHYDFTWGFFVAKIKKINSILNNKEIKPVKQNYEKLSKNEEKLVREFFLNNFSEKLEWYYLYKYKSDICIVSENLNYIWDKIFLYKIWVQIWEVKDSIFYPTFFAWTFKKFKKWLIEVNKEELDRYFKWYEVENDFEDWFYQLINDKIELWIIKQKIGKTKSLLPTNMMRK